MISRFLSQLECIITRENSKERRRSLVETNKLIDPTSSYLDIPDDVKINGNLSVAFETPSITARLSDEQFKELRKPFPLLKRIFARLAWSIDKCFYKPVTGIKWQ